MNDDIPSDMLEATRLTRAGRLTEATALLQRLLRGERASRCRAAHRTSRRHRLPDAAAHHRHDPETRSDAPSPLPRRAAPAPADARQPPWPGAETSLPQTCRQALRGFLDRVNGGGSRPGMGGLARGSRRMRPSRCPTAPRSDGVLQQPGRQRAPTSSTSPAATRGQAVPLVVMLHGCTQSPDDFAAGTRMNVLAEEHGCLVAYPAQPPRPTAPKCWNWFNRATSSATRASPR